MSLTEGLTSGDFHDCLVTMQEAPDASIAEVIAARREFVHEVDEPIEVGRLLSIAKNSGLLMRSLRIINGLGDEPIELDDDTVPDNVTPIFGKSDRKD